MATLRASLSSVPHVARLFEDKLLDGVHPNARGVYKTGYAFTRSTFRVAPGFPRLLESNLKPGVGDVTYSVVLSACEPFKVELENALAVLRTETVERPG